MQSGRAIEIRGQVIVMTVMQRFLLSVRSIIWDVQLIEAMLRRRDWAR